VSYLASDVARLADELKVDQQPISLTRRQDGPPIPSEMVRYVQEQSEAQKRTAERLEGYCQLKPQTKKWMCRQ
jgi:hypothetical protein